MQKKWIIAGAAVVAVCAVVLPRFRKEEKFASPVMKPIVEAVQPEKGNIRLETSVIGTVEPSDVVYIYPKASGDITAVNVKAGEKIEAGTVICTIDTKQVQNAKNSMDTASVNMRQAQEELNRQQILYSGGGLSEQDFAKYRNSAETARLQYNQAKYNYETQMDYSEIKAPIDGTVEICDVEVFDTVNQSQLIAVIAGGGDRVVSFSVTERIRGYLQEGDSIKIEKDGQSFAGKVYEVSMMADEKTGLYKIKASVENGAELPTGSRVKLTLTSKKTENAILVPIDAVYYKDTEPFIYTYNDGKVWERPIEAGIYDDKHMEVISGVSMDELVVKTWSSELYDGAVIRRLGEEAPEGEGAPEGGKGPGGPNGGKK